MELLATIAEHWELMAAGVVVMVASADKVALVIISSMKNVKDAWFTAFPGKKNWRE
jgi:hypothetical protein